MESPEAFLMSGMSSSSLDGGLTKSLSPAFSDNSPLTGLEQTFRFSASSSKASSGLDSHSPVLEGIFGNFNGHKNSQLNILDASGNSETFSLKGDGEGEVFKTYNGEQVVFTGTDASTQVQISAFNNIEFGDYVGSKLKVQTKGSIKAGNITLKNTGVSSSPGLSLQSGLGDVQNLTGSYSVTDLGSLPGYSYSYPTDINNSGQVVGYFSSSNGTHAFLYSDGKITDLGTLPGYSNSYANAINDSGQVVGYSSNNNGTHAFLYSNGQMTDLGTLPKGTVAVATSINKSGQVVGGANILEYHAPHDITVTGYRPTLVGNGYNYEPYTYTEHIDGYYSDLGNYAFTDSNGQMTNLGTLAGDSNSYATGINDSGQVVGYSSGTKGTHAFIDKNGHLTDLGTLAGDSNSYAIGINDSGQVVGYSSGTKGTHAFIDKNGHLTDLGTLAGDSDSEATGINDSGQVVGYSSGTKGTHAFIDSNAHLTDLNSLIPKESGWTLELYVRSFLTARFN